MFRSWLSVRHHIAQVICDTCGLKFCWKEETPRNITVEDILRLGHKAACPWYLVEFRVCPEVIVTRNEKNITPESLLRQLRENIGSFRAAGVKEVTESLIPPDTLLKLQAEAAGWRGKRAECLFFKAKQELIADVNTMVQVFQASESVSNTVWLPNMSSREFLGRVSWFWPS